MTGEKEPDERPRPVVIETGAGFWVVFLLLGGTVALMPGAEVMRLSGDWPSNPGWHPPIVGPGDTSWIWVEPDQPLETLRGEWRLIGGSAKLSVENAGAADKQPPEKLTVQVSSRDFGWSDVHATDARIPARLWARIHFDAKHQQLSNKLLRVELTLNVAFPEAGEKGVTERQKEVTATTAVHLGRPRVGFLYGLFWYTAMFGGGAMLLLAAAYHLLCDRALQTMGPPTRVTAVAGDDGPAAVPATGTEATVPAPDKAS